MFWFGLVLGAVIGAVLTFIYVTHKITFKF